MLTALIAATYIAVLIAPAVAAVVILASDTLREE